MSVATVHPSSVSGGVRQLLRIESAAILAAFVVAYHLQGGAWGRFALLFLVPDLAMVPYLWSRRAGAAAYNAAHSYLAPAALAALSMILPALGAGGLLVATIWGAHIAFDRAAGYGLKYATAFGDTHLGRVGRAAD